MRKDTSKHTRGSGLRTSLSRTAAFGALLTAASVMGPVATAQDAEGEEESNRFLETVTVTASKRETTLQDLPVSVSVTTGETIEQAQIRDLLDLQTIAPSLRISQNQSSSNATFIIRGFGNGANNVGIEPSVGLFIDGVFRSRSAAQIGDLANVSRVEVLRGPQSTLFGKNASAGVISIVTQEPGSELGGSAEVTYGNFNQVVVKGDISGPITDTLSFGLDAGYNRRDGFFDIVNLDEEINDRNRFNVRGQLVYRPIEDLKFRLIGDFSSLDETCCFAGNVVAGPTVPAIFAVGGAVVPEDVFSGETFLNIVPENEIDSYGVSLQTDWTKGPFDVTAIGSYRKLETFEINDVDFTSADVVNDQADQDIETITGELRVASNFDGPLNFLLGGFYFNEDISEESQLITGQDTRLFFELLAGAPGTFGGVEAALGLPANSIFSPGLLTDEAFTLDNESFSIFGTVDFEVTDRLTLTGGFNYTDDSKDFTVDFTALDELANINLVDAFIAGALGTTDPAAIGAFAAADPATFAAITSLALDPTQNPLLGLAPFQFQPPFPSVPNSVEDGRTRDDDFSYTLRANYELSDNVNVYFTYATGFKASSVNLSRDSRPLASDFTAGPAGSTILAPPSNILNAGLATPNLVSGTRSVDPEEAEVFEAGVKAQFDRIGFNLALFTQNLEDFQQNAFTGTGFALSNAGSSTINGVEFDTTIVPIKPLVLTFAVTYLDTVFDEFPGSSVGDITGEEIAGIAEFSIATSATYTHDFDNGHQLIGRIDYNHDSNVDINNGLPTFGSVPIFERKVNLVNTAITYRLDNGWEASVFARNLFDDEFFTTVFDGVAQAGTVSGYPNSPRTFGGSVRYKF
ncbi:MAG: TonB-dependent receptor [Hyphomonadaceae bacterium]